MNLLIKISLSTIILLIAIFPYLNTSDKSGTIEIFSSICPLGIIILMATFFSAIGFYCKSLQKCLSLISPTNRNANPKSVWFMFLLPFNFIEDFFIIINISNSIENETKYNSKLSSIKDNGMLTGIGWCIAQVLSFAPNVAGQIAGVLGLVLWLIHWQFINKINNLLTSKN